MFGTPKSQAQISQRDLRNAFRHIRTRLRKRRAFRLGAQGAICAASATLIAGAAISFDHLSEAPAWLSHAISRATLATPISLELTLILLIPVASIACAAIGLLWPVTRMQAARWADYFSTRSGALQSALEVEGPFAPLVAKRAAADAKRAYGDPSISIGLDRIALILLVLAIGNALAFAPGLILDGHETHASKAEISELRPMGADPSLGDALRDGLIALTLNTMSGGDSDNRFGDLLTQGQNLAEAISEGKISEAQAMATQNDLMQQLTTRLGSEGGNELLDALAENPALLDTVRTFAGDSMPDLDDETMKEMATAFGKDVASENASDPEQIMRNIKREIDEGRRNTPLLDEVLEGKITTEEAEAERERGRNIQRIFEGSQQALRGGKGAQERLERSVETLRKEREKRSAEKSGREIPLPPEVTPGDSEHDYSDASDRVRVTGNELRARAIDYESRRSNLPRDVRPVASKFLADKEGREASPDSTPAGDKDAGAGDADSGE